MLPSVFHDIPFAHRGLHDRGAGRPENSRAAVQAAVDAGYGIEIDLQLTSDEQALVFHDYDLARLTAADGTVRGRTASELGSIQLTDGDEGIPTFAEVLKIVAGRVPLLVEIKDQDGELGPSVGPLEAAATNDLADYAGPVAVMSFNPHSVAAMQSLAPDIPRGLVTDAFDPNHWPAPRDRLAELAAITDYDRVGASFISHGHRHLTMPRVAELKANGALVLCWTIRSPEDEARARKIADNITFEGYRP